MRKISHIVDEDMPLGLTVVIVAAGPSHLLPQATGVRRRVLLYRERKPVNVLVSFVAFRWATNDSGS